jgi:hypothetical protein
VRRPLYKVILYRGARKTLLEFDFLCAPAGAAEVRLVARLAREAQVDFLGRFTSCEAPSADGRTRITTVVTVAGRVTRLCARTPRLRVCRSHGSGFRLLDLVFSVLLALRAERVPDLGNDDHGRRSLEGV